MRKILLIAGVLALVLAGPLSAAAAPAARAVDAAAAPTTVNYYESLCASRARISRGIPPLTVDQSKGLIAWERSHAGTAAARDFHAALDACPPVARWDWGRMVLVHTEQYGR
jgi:hypothetical protein